LGGIDEKPVRIRVALLLWRLLDELVNKKYREKSHALAGSGVAVIALGSRTLARSAGSNSSIQ